MDIQFPLDDDDAEDETASVMDDAMEEDDNDDEEVELILREVFVDNAADEAFRFCCNEAVEGGGGAERIHVFPLFAVAVVAEMLNPFLFTAPLEDDDNLGVGELIFIRLVFLSSIQSTEVGDIAVFVDSFPLTFFRLLACPFKYILLVIFEDLGGR